MLINKINKEKTYKILEKLLIVFFIIQPIFDLKIFYNSVSSLIRVCIVFLLFIICFLLDKNKNKWYLIIYSILIGIYFIFHHLHALSFKSLVPGNFNYSIIKETLYFVKMITPLMLVYVLFQAKPSKDKIIKIIIYIVLIMSLNIIITNVLGISYSSYSDEIIKGNFFQWFSKNNIYSYQALASKGLFKYANQISAILLMFLPFCLIKFLDKKQLLSFIIVLVNVFSLILLSTKVAVFGVILVFVYTIIIYFFNVKLKKENINKSSFYILVGFVLIYGLILPKNPALKRIDETKLIAASVETIDYEEEVENKEHSNQENINMHEEVETIENQEAGSAENIKSEYEEVIEYIEQNYRIKNIKEEFIKISYPYTSDPYFWQEIFSEPYVNRVNYRYLEQAMIKRIVEKNNNKNDFWFGITNTRLQNVFNIEKDFIVQYYAVGIIGVILLFGPYLLLLARVLYITIKNNIKTFNIYVVISFITIIMTFGISYYSGNLLNSLSFTIYFVLLFRMLNSNVE